MTANYSAEYASTGWKIGNLTSYYASNNLVLGSGFGSGGSTLETDGDVFIGGNLHIIGNISNTDITHLNINGSLFPGLDAMFDLGNNSLNLKDFCWACSANPDIPSLVLQINIAPRSIPQRGILRV